MLERWAGRLMIAGPWRRALAAFAAGALAALSLAPVHAFPVLAVAFPILVLTLDAAMLEARRRRAVFAVGWCFGLGYFLGGLWWIGAAFTVDVGAPHLLLLMPFAVGAMAAGLALFTGLGCLAALPLWRPGWGRVVALAATLSLSDWLRGTILTGFPWNAFGYGLAANAPLMQGASVVGLYGLSFLAVLIFASPVVLVDGRRQGRGLAIVAAGLFAALIAAGAARIAWTPAANVPGVKLRLMQPAIAQDRKWRPENKAAIIGDYVSLSVGADGKGLDGVTHLIWPESAFPFLLDRDAQALRTIATMLPPETRLLTGAIRAEPPGPGERKPRYFNSLLALDTDATIDAVYDKAHLVPFGEYLPLRAALSWTGIGAFLYPLDDFSAGPAPRTLAIGGAPAVSPVICYEAIFPGAVVDETERPGWILNVTNDGWFGATAGPWQHLHQARLRAVEEGLPLVRVANTGISVVVDAVGRMSGHLDIGQRGTLDAPLPVALPVTAFARLGNYGYFCMILAALVSILASNPSRRHHP